MFKILYGGFTQETNTFCPKICTRDIFEAGTICFGQDIIDKYYGKAMDALAPAGLDAEQTERLGLFAKQIIHREK